MKNKKSNKKYTIDPQLSDTISNQSYISDIREQLREAFEELEQYKLSSEL
jgi:ribosomal protein S20